jgi:hypothetical protein
MFLLQCVRRYEQKFASLFNAADYRNRAFVSCGADYLVTDASRVAFETSPDATRCDCSFDIGKDQAIIYHLLKEVRDRKLIFTTPHFLSYDVDDSQSRFSSQAYW